MKREKQEAHLAEKSFWRSLEERSGKPEFSADLDYERALTEEEKQKLRLNRRQFLTLAGVMTALTTAGCVRKPVEKILPATKRPEELLKGKPLYYATSTHLGRRVLGLLVESQEGRPTKIEGNDQHPMSRGATDLWTQASILDLYDPDRAKLPSFKAKKRTWGHLFRALNETLNPLKRKAGEGLALLIEEKPSPTFHFLLDKLKKKYPKARIFLHDSTTPHEREEAFRTLGLRGYHPFYRLERANVIFSVDSDFLHTEGDAVFHARAFGKRRGIDAVEAGPDGMNRLYVVEPRFSLTGMNADHRLPLLSSDLTDFMTLLTDSLISQLDAQLLASFDKKIFSLIGQRARKIRKIRKDEVQKWHPFLQALSSDLLQHRGKGAIIIGDRQPARLHALGLFLNTLLDNLGSQKPLNLLPDAPRNKKVESLDALLFAIARRQIQALLVFGGNPVYTGPADKKLSELFRSVPASFHLSLRLNETSQHCHWHIPTTHFLEEWGDLQALDGTISLVQPLIAPLYDALSPLEWLAFLLGERKIRGYQILRSFWREKRHNFSDFEAQWRRWLHDGFIPNTQANHVDAVPNWSKLKKFYLGEPNEKKELLEVNFTLDNSLFDGRFANNAWLQELPDPLSKLTWDNAALISPQLARKHGLSNGDFVQLSFGDRTLSLPIFIIPGIAEKAIILPLGYGQGFGKIATLNRAFNTYLLRTSYVPHFALGVELKPLSKRTRYPFASTQEHGRLEDPDLGVKGFFSFKGTRRSEIVETFDIAEWPSRTKQLVARKKNHASSLWDKPNNTSGQQWGMAIDLNRCIACGACIIACQAENNIPVVGKEQVLNGREMSWLRIDRYFTGPVDEPAIVNQPVACSHCENAPCETVCPVAATTHSDDGLNDMTYNRCIGTRYCANNCPYKVRRFNYFNFSQRNEILIPELKMQRNPDVTVRFRGVMEKCSYCVQRINEAKIKAKREGNGLVPDGSLKTACQQACPSQAIVFGDINDLQSEVSRWKKAGHDYCLLPELNTQPRTSYLAKIRNPHPLLKKMRTSSRSSSSPKRPTTRLQQRKNSKGQPTPTSQPSHRKTTKK